MTEAGDGRADRYLEVVLISGDVVRFRNFEFVQAIKHRYALVPYGFAALSITLLDLRSNDETVSMVAFMQHVATSLLAAIMVLILVPVLGMVTLKRKGGVLRVRASVLLIAASAMGVATGQMTLYYVEGTLPGGLARLVVMVIFYYLVGEVIYSWALLFVVPRMLRDMRGATAQEENSPDSADGRSGPILIKGERFAPETLCCVRADGNYILVRTLDRRVLLPGPFGPVADALPADLGMRVSRSDWVARAAVVRVHRKGRDVTLDLVDRTSVKVAQVRRKAVLDWLKATAQGGASATGEAMSTQTG